LYLNDVEEGGETEFPRLGLRVRPKTGRAVLWPSVLDSHPNHWDQRSDHQALPVVKGIKYGANAWVSLGPCHEQNERAQRTVASDAKLVRRAILSLFRV
jgi:hypothetical protein